MKKRFFALLTAVCIALTTGLTTGLTALADGGENSDMTIGMSAQEHCSCTTLCTEGNINPDCPVCGAEGADLTACKGAPLMMRAAPLAAGGAPSQLYVGNQQVSSGNDITYWTTDEGGNLTQSADNQSWNVKYDPTSATLTLSGATIKEGSDVVSIPYGSGIYALSSSGQSVTLTIELIGENTITGYYGIYVNAEISADSNGTDASLTITGENNGSLEVSGSNHGIFVKSGTGDASLTIKNASVDAKTTQTYSNYAGVCVQSGASATGSPNISLSVNGGSLTASGTGSRDGILFYVGSSQATGATTSLTVSENAIVDARNGGISALKISETLPTPTPTGENSSGIVWNGSEGTVYGDVELQDNLEIKSGETLTIPDGSSLNTNGKLTNNGTIINKGTLTGDVGGSGTVITAPTITTADTDLPDGTVGTEYKQTLTATGSNITWSSNDLPAWLTLDNSTGVITGTPTTADTYNFTVTAKNSAGSDDKTFTLKIGVAPVYSITADPLKLDFGTLTEGYTPASQTVTITNNGNQELTLTQPASTEHFEVGNLSTLTLPANGTATFTVQPQAGLAAGTYSEDIDVTASNNATATISASLTVQKASVPTKPEVPSTGTTSGGSTGESTYPDVEDAQTSYEQATRNFWNRTINKIKKADEGDSLRIYIGIHEEIPGDVIQAIRENGVNVTFYNQDGDEVTVYAESAPTKYQAVWTLKQLGNYVLTEQQTPAAQEESPADQQPADEPTTPTQPAETEAVDTAKPNPSTGEGSGAVIAVIAAAAALAGLGATLRKR